MAKRGELDIKAGMHFDDDVDFGDLKYILVSDPNNEDGYFRVAAVKDFTCQDRKVKKGDIGGLVGGPDVLDQEGKCWIFDDAIADRTAIITGDAKISGNAKLGKDAFVSDIGEVRDNADVSFCVISGAAEVYDNAVVRGTERMAATVDEWAQVYGNCFVDGEYAIVNGTAALAGDTHVCPDTCVSIGFYEGNEEFSDDTWTFDGWDFSAQEQEKGR